MAIKKRDNLSVVIGVQFLLIPDNLEDLLTFINLFKDTGVDNVQIKPYSQHPLSKNRYSIEYAQYQGIEDTVRKYETPEFQVIFRSQTTQRLMMKRTYHECYGLPFYTLIEADGSIIPCNLFHNNEDFYYGNLYDESFTTIWNGKRGNIFYSN